MSTLNEREALLRRALHAAADAVDPQADGLERIQARLHRPRPLALAWAESVWTDVRLRTPAQLEAWLERLLGATALAWERFGPRRGTSGGRASRTLGWLRPIAALSVTVFIVAAGAYVAIDAQQAIFPSSSNTPHSAGSGSGGGAASGVSGSVGTQGQSASAYGSLGRKAKSASCKQTKSAGGAAPSGSPTPGQIQSPTPTVSPSDSASGVPSSTPSPTDTATAQPTSTATEAAQSTTAPITQVSVSPTLAVFQAVAGHAATPAASSSPCAKRKQVKRNTGPTAQPNGSPAVFSVGKLNDDN